MSHRSLSSVVVVVCLCCVPAQLTIAQTGTNIPSGMFGDTDYQRIEGFSQPFRTASVAAAVSGIVDHRTAEEGMEVRENDCLIKLDDSVHQQLVEISRTAKEAQGELATARAELAARRTRLQRIEALADRQHATPVELLQAREQVALAEANLLTVEEKHLQRAAEFERLSAEAQQYCIAAPFDGVVVRFLKEEGEYVGAVDPDVCVLAQLNVLSVNFLIPREYRPQFQTGGQAGILFVDSQRQVNGSVYYISPFPDGETNMFTVKVRIDNADRKLNAGSRCHLLNVNSSPQGTDESPSQLTMQLK